MIQIRTTLPKVKVDPAWRLRVANELSRFMPDYSTGGVSYPISDENGAYVIDGHNDWWCHVDDDDSQLVTINFREAAMRPGVEFAFANWVIAKRLNWEIIPARTAASAAPTGTAASVSVLFDVRFPFVVDDWELGTLSFEIPIESVGVFLDGKLVPGASVTGYTTSDDIETT